MRHPMMSVLEQNPVLPAVKDAGRLEACLAQPAGVVFLLCGDILNIDRLIDRVHQAGKYAVVHADLVAGLAPREIAVDFLHRCGADGIISTRPMLLRRGRELGLLTVLRVFAIDSKAVSNLGRETEGGMPDVIEILPGTLCKVLRRLSRELPVPLIAGGLLSDKADVLAALGAGALCVSASDESLGALWAVPKGAAVPKGTAGYRLSPAKPPPCGAAALRRWGTAILPRHGKKT